MCNTLTMAWHCRHHRRCSPLLLLPCCSQVWQLRGRYPNRGYPKIFNDPNVGAEAKKLFEEAQVMLRDFIAHKRVRLNGIVGFYPANAVGDDIEVYDDDEGRSTVRTKFFGLRQQAEKEGDEPYMCVSDFIAPKGSGVKDYIGMFACSAGHGLEEVVEKYKEAGDDYSYIMAEALADRLAEAFAEKLHELVRQEVWGYAPDEALTVDDMLKVKYQVRWRGSRGGRQGQGVGVGWDQAKGQG